MWSCLLKISIILGLVLVGPDGPIVFLCQSITTIHCGVTIYCQALCQHVDNLSRFYLQGGFNIFHNIVPASPPALPKREGAEVQRTLLLH